MSKTNAMHDTTNKSFTLAQRKKKIRLQMTNFRTYGAAEVEIPSNSTTLINGPSGVGKSTIMEFVLFCLYDGVSQPERFGTKRCWGWLLINDLAIYRQKDPKLLKLWVNDFASYEKMGDDVEIQNMSGREYTNDEAQQIINSRFGSMNVFLATSYLRQKEFSVILNGTDAEKLAIIKEVATKNCEMDELKKPIKERLRICETQSLTTRAQLDQATQTMQKFDAQNPQINQSQEILQDPDEAVSRVRELRTELQNLDESYQNVVAFESQKLNYQKDIQANEAMVNMRNKQIESMVAENAEEKLQNVKLQIDAFSGTTVDAQNAAKAQLYKNWQSKSAQVEKTLTTGVAGLKRVLNIFKTSIPDSIPEEITDEFLTTLDQERLNNLELLREKASTENQKSIQATLEFNALMKTYGFSDGLVKEKELLKSKQKQLETDQESLKEMKTVLDEYRKSRKWDCPECSTTLIMSEDGKSLQKIQDSAITVTSSEHPSSIISPTPTPPVVPKSDSTPSITTITPPPSALPPAKTPAKSSINPALASLMNVKPTTLPVALASSTPIPPTSPIPPVSPTPSSQSNESKHSESCKYSNDDLIALSSKVARESSNIDIHKANIEELEILEKTLPVNHNIDDEYTSEIASLGVRLQNVWASYNAAKQAVLDHENSKPEPVEDVSPTDNTKQLQEHKAEAERLQKILNTISSTEMLREMLITRIDELKKALSELISNNAAVADLSSMGIKTRRAECQAEIDRLLHLSTSNDLLAHRSILEKTMHERLADAQLAERQHAACKRLLDKAVEAERISLETAVNEINHVLAAILKRLFTNVPISVQLRTTKQLKTKKGVSQKFDIEIFYGQSKYSHSRQLSGGEKDRLSLAITMALNQKFGGNLLFLDETLSSLDSELKGEVVALLKDFSAQGRTVVTVSHEETEGLYDQVIRIASRQ